MNEPTRVLWILGIEAMSVGEKLRECAHFGHQRDTRSGESRILPKQEHCGKGDFRELPI
jgi:hypothetical protein